MAALRIMPGRGNGCVGGKDGRGDQAVRMQALDRAAAVERAGESSGFVIELMERQAQDFLGMGAADFAVALRQVHERVNWRRPNRPSGA